MTHLHLGRNGGNLTPVTFKHFHENEKLYGTDEALRALAIENYTISEILRILHTEELGDAVDLVQGGHAELHFTEKESETAKANFDSAKSAGVDLSLVEWITQDQMESVSNTFLLPLVFRLMKKNTEPSAMARPILVFNFRVTISGPSSLSLSCTS
jgi:hypothetical protein